MTTLINDIKYGFRQLIKSPGFTIVAVLILTLGIGASTAIFSLVNGVILHPMPYDQPEQLVQFWENQSGRHRDWSSVAGRTFADWKEQVTLMEDISAVRRTHLNLTGVDRPQRLSIHRVSASYLKIFRVQPLLGRGFLPDEDQPGKERVVVLTYSLWKSSFGRDPNVINRAIRLGSDSYTVVGVLPAKPKLPFEFDAIVPFVFGSAEWHHSRDDHRLRVIGRIKPGVTLEKVRAEMNTITETLRPSSHCWKEGYRVVVVPMHEQITGEIRSHLWILFGAVAFVLLIACANVASLLMTRMAQRQREIAIRLALGSQRGRIINQLLIESLLLSLLGGILGILFAYWAVELILRFETLSLPLVHKIGIDIRVLGFALLVSIFTGLVFGLAPALRLVDSNLNDFLKKGGIRQVIGSVSCFHRVAVVAQVALALMLLIGAGLLLRTLLNLASVPVGFNPDNVLVMDISLDHQKYPNREQRATFLKQILERLESLPGVKAAATATTLPMNSYMNTSISDERQPDQSNSSIGTNYDFIAGDYCGAMGIPLLKGRVFSEKDNTRNARCVVMINQVLASKIFLNKDPLSQRIRFWGQSCEIVGVVGNVHQHGLDKNAKEQIYLPQVFSPWVGCLVVRTKVPPLTLTETVRKEIQKLDPDQPISNVRTLEQVVIDSTRHRRSISLLLGSFAGVALLLSSIGLYGVMAYTVTLRTREIGIRIALGGQQNTVVRLFMSRGVKLIMIGLALGLLAAFVLTGVMRHLLFGIVPKDPITFVAVSLLLTIVGLIACYIPVRRAAKIDPMEALRYE